MLGNRKGVVAVAAVVAAVVPAGCVATTSDVTGGTKEMVLAVKEAKGDLSKEHVHLIEGDMAALKQRVAEGDAKLAVLAHEASNNHDLALENEKQWKDLGRVALTVADVATGGRVSGIFDRVSTRVDGLQERVAKSIDGVQADLQKSVADLTTSGARLEERVKVSEAALAEARKALETLSKDTQDKLSKIRPEQVDRLEADLRDPAKFKATFAQVAEDLGLSKEDKEKLLGLPPEVLWALLVSMGVGGTGGTYAARKMSHSKTEIEKLQKEVDELWDLVAKLQPKTPVAVDPPPHS